MISQYVLLNPAENCLSEKVFIILLNSAENCLSTHIYICCQKKEFMIYVALATKLENHKKKVFRIYVHVIHVCLDVALMEGDLYPSVISKEHPLTGAAYS